MSSNHEDRLDPNKPALIVLYGATKRKFRPLEGDLVVLGRAAGCDIGLVSPEVAPVHCVLVRQAEGWRIRDCSGRGTRLNGKSIRDEALRNGDTIQIGTFSFEAQLPGVNPIERGSGNAANRPAGADTTGFPSPEVERLQQSRRRLAELALGLRRRIREQAAERNEVAHQQAELEQVQRRLRKAHDEQQARQTSFAEAQKELARRAAELDHFAAHLKQQRVEQSRLGEELALERQELTKQHVEFERLREQQLRLTPASSRETQYDPPEENKLESARKLLRDLAERRKAAAGGQAKPRNSRARQARPPVEEGGTTHEPRTK